MKRHLLIAFMLAPSLVFAADPPDPGKTGRHDRCDRAPRAWLGLQVSRPDESTTVHLPGLPPGIGFIVNSIDENGPAQQAGILELDVLCMMGDQMLANEAQLAALLRLAKPGDEITFSGFRAGKPLKIQLKLGEAPKTDSSFPPGLVDGVVLNGECGGPVRIVNVSEKTASLNTDDGRAEVRKTGEGYSVKIQDPADKLIYEGNLSEDGNLEKIPNHWRRRVYALRRGLDHSLENGPSDARQPRPRVVPPFSQKP